MAKKNDKLVCKLYEKASNDLVLLFRLIQTAVAYLATWQQFTKKDATSLAIHWHIFWL